MYKKLAKDIRTIDIALVDLLNQIDKCTDVSLIKNMWLRVNRLYTTRNETLRLMRKGYNVLNQSPLMSELEILPVTVVQLYAKVKGFNITSANSTGCKSFKDIVNNSSKKV